MLTWPRSWQVHRARLKSNGKRVVVKVERRTTMPHPGRAHPRPACAHTGAESGCRTDISRRCVRPGSCGRHLRASGGADVLGVSARDNIPPPTDSCRLCSASSKSNSPPNLTIAASAKTRSMSSATSRKFSTHLHPPRSWSPPTLALCHHTVYVYACRCRLASTSLCRRWPSYHTHT